MTDTEMRKGFHDELENIRDGITHLAASVTEAIPRATAAGLSQQPAELAGYGPVVQLHPDFNDRLADFVERTARD